MADGDCSWHGPPRALEPFSGGEGPGGGVLGVSGGLGNSRLSLGRKDSATVSRGPEVEGSSLGSWVQLGSQLLGSVQKQLWRRGLAVGVLERNGCRIPAGSETSTARFWKRLRF